MSIRCALCKASNPGGKCAGEPWPCVPQDDERVTEAEYRAWLAKRLPEIAEELSTQFAGVLPPGVHFEWMAEP